MKMWEMLQAAYDFWRPNKYGIKPYLCKDALVNKNWTQFFKK